MTKTLKNYSIICVYVIFVFNIVLVNANELSCGDIDPRVYIDDNMFKVHYYNTKSRTYFEDTYDTNGKAIVKRAKVQDDISNHISYHGISGKIPTGKSNPLGNFPIPKALSVCFFRNSILYSIIGPSIPENIKQPFLEIRDRKNVQRKIDFKWNRVGFDFQNTVLFVNDGNIFGTLFSSGHDTLYLYQAKLEDGALVQYKLIGLSSTPRYPIPNTMARDCAISTNIKCFGNTIQILCADSTDDPKLAIWNYGNNFFSIIEIPSRIVAHESFPAEFSRIGDHILLTWIIKHNENDYCSSKVISVAGKLKF